MLKIEGKFWSKLFCYNNELIKVIIRNIAELSMQNKDR